MGDFDDLIAQLAKEVYEAQGNVYSSELVKTTADKLTEAISEGFGDIEADWDTPDKVMLDKLTQNVFSFSAAKNYQQLNDMTLALRDDKGNLREFGDFKEAVEQIGVQYNQTWLQTEYDTAIASSTMSARWVEFQSEAEIFPMLEYQTVGDDKVRASHKLLDGVIKKVGSDFWKKYYPPNGWNCRCEVIQLPNSDAKETATPPNLPYVPEMFKTNLSESGLIFPKDHPYYDGVPKDILRRAMQYIPEENAYRTKEGFREHAMLQYEPEATENRTIAKILAENGIEDIKLMPRLHEKEKELRKKVFGESYVSEHPTKNPDSLIDGNPVEFKESGMRNMSKRIYEASKQADRVVIKAKDKLTTDYITRFIHGQWELEDRQHIKQIIIISDGKMYKFDHP